MIKIRTTIQTIAYNGDGLAWNSRHRESLINKSGQESRGYTFNSLIKKFDYTTTCSFRRNLP